MKMQNVRATPFELVGDFMEVFGQQVNCEPTLRDRETQDLRIDLISEELEELQLAITNNDIVEVADALTDLLYVVYGAGASFGIDLDKAFHLVHESNMSKVCKDKATAERTVQWYKEQYAAKTQPYDTPAMRPDPVDPTKYIVYNASTGKVLKSIEYNPVSFESLLATAATAATDTDA